MWQGRTGEEAGWKGTVESVWQDTKKKWRAATDGERRAERRWGKWKSEGWMILFEMQDKRGISIQGNGLKSRETE